jgi:hypothetical protein
MEEVRYYAYIHCKPDGVPFYVGKGKGSRCRLMSERNPHHQRVINKHGAKNILFGTLNCSSEATAFELEIGLIKCLKRANVRLTNMTAGGEGQSGAVASAETRAKQSKAHIGNQHAKGLVHSPEAKARMSAARKGTRASDATRKRMSASRIGVRKGPVSEETRKKLSAKSKGVPRAPMRDETKAKLSAARTGVIASAATRAKMSASRIGVRKGPVSEETRKRMSAALKAVWSTRKSLGGQ